MALDLSHHYSSSRREREQRSEEIKGRNTNEEIMLCLLYLVR